MKDLLTDLQRPFPLSEVRWRVLNGSENGVRLSPYVDRKQIFQRFTDVLGMPNWNNSCQVNDRCVKSRIEITIDEKVLFREGIGDVEDRKGVSTGEAFAIKRAAHGYGVGVFPFRVWWPSAVKRVKNGKESWHPADPTTGKRIGDFELEKSLKRLLPENIDLSVEELYFLDFSKSNSHVPQATTPAPQPTTPHANTGTPEQEDPIVFLIKQSTSLDDIKNVVEKNIQGSNFSFDKYATWIGARLVILCSGKSAAAILPIGEYAKDLLGDKDQFVIQIRKKYAEVA